MDPVAGRGLAPQLQTPILKLEAAEQLVQPLSARCWNRPLTRMLHGSKPQTSFPMPWPSGIRLINRGRDSESWAKPESEGRPSLVSLRIPPTECHAGGESKEGWHWGVCCTMSTEPHGSVTPHPLIGKDYYAAARSKIIPEILRCRKQLHPSRLTHCLRLTGELGT